MEDDTLSSLPSRPLKKQEINIFDEAGPYSIRRHSDEIYAFVFVGSEGVHGLGYDDDRERWVNVESVSLPYSSEKATRLRRSVFDWVELTYPSAFEDGKVEHLTRDDGHDHSHDHDVTVTMGPGAEYDCPECEWFRTGRTTAPRIFTDHLEDDHDYTTAEAREAFH